jgi:hypothetical protein
MSYGFTTCAGCGLILQRWRLGDHECEQEKWIAHQVACALPEIEGIDRELASYLESARGRFDLWYAERARRQAA